ncbi:uncharacterized protein LOC112054382 [Bicyclus anynana]|uniref:Uncharacterized protein LOC112054382 n=1 Tax=Bicyclus anynana TaxID=110368 RepID=A0ABM3LTF3_BICAN|nr:uncharacterized protein LOC112054382 [Bicyclus anynana]
MRLHSLCSCNFVFLCGIILLVRTEHGKCNPITNSNLNEHIREFAPKENDINSTIVKTLQKEDSKRYTDVVSYHPIHFKDVPDNKQSSSSYGRGLISREHSGFALHDYEEYPHINYGYDYHLPEAHPHGYDHHDFNHHHGYYDGHYNLGHHKHYSHALAAKAVLWPIAGIALLGAAAALVSNPILLQLGVASGKRRRRNTEEITGPELSTEITEWRPFIKRNVAVKTGTDKLTKTKLFDRKSQRSEFSTKHVMKRNPTSESPFQDSDNTSTEKSDEINFVPLPIKHKYD